MALIIRCGERQDLPALIQLHVDAFPRHSLTQLGRLVISDYYKMAFSHQRLMTLAVAADGGRVVGFGAILADPSRFYEEYGRRRAYIGLLALPALARKPSVIRMALGANRRGRETSTAQTAGAAELSSLAVASDCRRTGAGSRIVEHLRREAWLRGDYLYLWADAQDNVKTLAFYDRLGFQREGARSFDGTRTLLKLVSRQPSTPTGVAE